MSNHLIIDRLGGKTPFISDEKKERIKNKAKENLETWFKLEDPLEMLIRTVLIIDETSDSFEFELVDDVFNTLFFGTHYLKNVVEEDKKEVIKKILQVAIRNKNARYIQYFVNEVLKKQDEQNEDMKIFYEEIINELHTKVPKLLFPRIIKEQTLNTVDMIIPDFDIYDAIEMENISSGEYIERNQNENIIISTISQNGKFNVKESIDFTKSELKDILNYYNFYYKCDGEKSPLFMKNNNNIDSNFPFVKLARGIVYFIPASYIRAIINSPFKYFVLSDPQNITNTTHLKNIQIEPGQNFEGDEINFISSDHCQKETDKKVFTHVMAVNVQLDDSEKLGEKRKRGGWKRKYKLCSHCGRYH